jgi:hypothetical protein
MSEKETQEMRPSTFQEIQRNEALCLPLVFFFLLRRWRKGERVSAYNKYCMKILGKYESYKLMTWD